MNTKKINNIKFTNELDTICWIEVHNSICELLLTEYGLDRRAYLKQIEKDVNRAITPYLSTIFMDNLVDVANKIENTYDDYQTSSEIHTNVEIEYITDVQVDVTIYLTDANGNIIYTRKLTCDIFLLSEDNQQVMYLENNLMAFDYIDIQSALQFMIEDLFLEHQQVKIKKEAKIRGLHGTLVCIDSDFDDHLYTTAIYIEDHANLTSNDRIKLELDYFKADWLHVRVRVTIYNPAGDRKTVKVSGDLRLFGSAE